MRILVLSCLFGAACGMGLWAAVSVRATIDEIVRRSGRPFPPGEA